VSGLDTTSLINKLIQVEQQPITNLQTQNTTYQSQLSAWQDLNTGLLAMQKLLAPLSDGTAFQAASLSSSDTSLLSGTCDGTAQPGSYLVTVNTLARTEQLNSQGFADSGKTTVGTGTISLGAGPSGETAANYLSGVIDSVTLADKTTLTQGNQTLVIDAVGSAATQATTDVFAGADVDTARQDAISTAGTLTINGHAFTFDGTETLGSVVDAINAQQSTTGVQATITGSADNWQVTLTNQNAGSNKIVNVAETADIINGGSANNFSVAGTDASAHIGSLQFNLGKGNALKDSAGDTIVLDTNATIGTQTNAFNVVGKYSITVDNTNNTLSGLAAAINKSGAGVTATIINDGSTSPYHLVLTSNTSGTAGQIILDTSQLTGGTAPVFSTMQAAQDASITLGSGAGAINITESTNSISDVIPGVTLNLNQSDPKTQVTVAINRDTTTIQSDIDNFVTAFNNVGDYFNNQNSWDTTSKTGGVLFGNVSLQNIQTDMWNIVQTQIPALNAKDTLLSEIGITATQNGELKVDDTKLAAAISSNFDDVQRLFTTTGTSSSSDLKYVTSTSATQSASPSGYAVNVTALGSAARITAGVSQTGVLAADETLTLNGQAIALTAGMTQAQVISKINETTNLSGVIASGTLADGTGSGTYLTLTQAINGRSKHITVTSDESNGGQTLAHNTSGIGMVQVTEINPFGETTTGTGIAGTDVQGTINGEAATGDGDFLTGKTNNLTTDGLKVQVTATSTGNVGTINFTKGISSMLNDYITAATDSINGSITGQENVMNTLITQNNDDITKMQTALAAKKDQLIQQFSDMENAIANLQSQSQYLMLQFTQLQAIKSGSGVANSSNNSNSSSSNSSSSDSTSNTGSSSSSSSS